MKYDFSTYILNNLNEDKKESKKPYSTADEIKAKLNEFILDDGVIKYKKPDGKPGDKVSVDTLKEIKNGAGWKDYNKVNKNDKMVKAIIKTTTEHENKNTMRAFDKEGFKLLGQTIAYRSALTFWNVANTSGEDFKQAAIDAFKDESEYSVKQLENLDSLLDYSAALQTVKTKEKRLDDKNNKDNDKILSKLKELETQIISPYKYSAIQEVKKTYGKEFNDNRDIFEKAFNDGMAAQKEEMSKPDYKWEDPVTKLPPKGKMAKANVVGDKLFKKLEGVSKKADEWIKQQKGLDWAILKLCSLGVHGLVYGGKELYKLLGKIYKRTNIIDNLRFTKKYKEIIAQIDTFKKEYDEWSNNKEDEKAKNTILMKFSELLNNYVVPYYYSKLCIIVACVENIDNKYIIRQENNKWSTLNTSTGNLTIIEDNAILAQRMLEKISSKEFEDVFNTFEKEPCADAFKAIPQDLNFNSIYSSNYLKWIDKIKEGKIDKEKLKNLLKVYNDKIIKIQFGSYKEFFDYINNAKVAYKECDFPTVKEITITFDSDEDAGVPGVVTGVKKEEQNDENEYDTIVNQINKELKELKSFNELKDVANNFQKAAADIDTGYKQVKQLNNKLPDTQKAELKNMFKDDITNVFGKLMYINVSKKMNGIAESFSYNKMMMLLLLENNGENDNYDELLNILSNKNMDSETVKEFKDKYKTFAEEMFNWYKELKVNNKDVATALEKVSSDPLALYLARKTLKKDEESKEENGENNQETQSS